MKKIITVVVLLSMLTTTLFSHKTKRDEGVVIGLKGGLNASKFLSSDIISQKTRSGFHIGFISEIIVSEKVSFQPELLYSSQGNVEPLTKQKYEYLNIPLILRYVVSNSLSIDAGAQIGFLINSFRKGNDANTNLSNQNFIDFAGVCGATYELYNIFFQARYNLGPVNTNSADNSDIFKYQNSVFQLSSGYNF